MIKRIVWSVFCAVILVLQSLPFGVKLIFAGENGERWVHLYSYFSMMPFGYATFGPLLCALITCAILIASIIYALKQTDSILLVLSILSFVASVLSASQFLYGASYVTLLGVVITGLLLAMAIASIVIYVISKKKNKSY